MKLKQAFSDKSMLKIPSKSSETFERLQSYIEYTDISDLIMSYYGSQFDKKKNIRV